MALDQNHFLVDCGESSGETPIDACVPDCESAGGIVPIEAPDNAECIYLMEQNHTPEEVIAHGKAVSRKALQIAESLGLDVDLELVRSAALLHDIARIEPHHSEAGASHLIKCGYPRIAEIIRYHHRLRPSDLETITECTLVFYADKLIRGTEEVTLEQRFEKSSARCLSPEAQAAHRLQYEQARCVREKLDSLKGG